MKKAKVLRSTNWQSQSGHGGVKNSRGNIVSNTVLTMYSVTGVLELPGESLRRLAHLSDHYAVNQKLAILNVNCN